MRVVADDGAQALALCESRIAGGMDKARAEKIYTRHLEGIQQARADLRALREFAEAQRGKMPARNDGTEWDAVPLEGELTDGQRRTLHEVTATAFENYMMKGEAPSSKLAGVFQRMKDWLKKIYRGALVNGITPSPEVARVFDRLLTTDAAMQNKNMKAAFGNEQQFIDALDGLDPKTGAAFNELLGRAESEVQARMDAATLKDREARWRAHYKDGREAVGQDPFWQAVDDISPRRKTNDGLPAEGGINKNSLLSEYGEDAVRQLSRRRPKLINSHERGLNLDEVADMLGYESSGALWKELNDRLVHQGQTKEGQARKFADQALAAEDAAVERSTHAGDDYAQYLDKIQDTMLRLAVRERAGLFTPEQLDRFIERNRTPRRQLADQVRRELWDTPYKDIRLDRYQAALAKALQERTASLAASDVGAALKAVDRARLAHESVLQAQKLITERERLESEGQRLGRMKPGVVPDAVRDGINDVLDRVCCTKRCDG